MVDKAVVRVVERSRERLANTLSIAQGDLVQARATEQSLTATVADMTRELDSLERWLRANA